MTRTFPVTWHPESVQSAIAVLEAIRDNGGTFRPGAECVEVALAALRGPERDLMTQIAEERIALAIAIWARGEDTAIKVEPVNKADDAMDGFDVVIRQLDRDGGHGVVLNHYRLCLQWLSSETEGTNE